MPLHSCLPGQERVCSGVCSLLPEFLRMRKMWVWLNIVYGVAGMIAEVAGKSVGAHLSSLLFAGRKECCLKFMKIFNMKIHVHDYSTIIKY